MGQIPSSAFGKKRQIEIGEELAPDIFSLWPSLETQLELSFNSLDLDEIGLLPYSTLEPLLRHHLMQIGLIEYITRFTTPNGTLDKNHITHYLREYQINLKDSLDIVDWKNLMLSWIRCVQDAQESDIRHWQNSIKDLAIQKENEYKNALKLFQDHYINHLEDYYKNIDQVHQQEIKYREDWETQLSLQEAFYSMQVDFINKQEMESDTHFKQINESKLSVEEEYIKYLKTPTYVGPENVKVMTYFYPASVTSTGAPVSAGAQVPFRKHIPKIQHKGCC